MTLTNSWLQYMQTLQHSNIGILHWLADSVAAMQMCNDDSLVANTQLLTYKGFRMRHAEGHALPVLWDGTISTLIAHGDILLGGVQNDIYTGCSQTSCPSLLSFE